MARPARFLQYGRVCVIDLDAVTAVVEGSRSVLVYVGPQDNPFEVDVVPPHSMLEIHRRIVAKVWGGCANELLEEASEDEDEDEDEEQGPYPYLDEEAGRAYGAGLTAVIRDIIDKAAARLHPADKREGEG